MRIELILNEQELKQLAATLGWCGNWTEFVASDPTISDERRKSRKYEASVCFKVKELLLLALKESEIDKS